MDHWLSVSSKPSTGGPGCSKCEIVFLRPPLLRLTVTSVPSPIYGLVCLNSASHSPLPGNPSSSPIFPRRGVTFVDFEQASLVDQSASHKLPAAFLQAESSSRGPVESQRYFWGSGITS